MKQNESIIFDKLSYGDFAVAAAYTTIQAANGPVMLDEFAFGRKDANSVEEAGDYQSIPTHGSSTQFVSYLKERGFSDEEIVALASVEAFGSVNDPKRAQLSSFPVLDNFYYKQLLTVSDKDAGSLPHYKELNSSQDLIQIVQKYADSQGEYHKTFKQAFVKLCDIGYAYDDLEDIEGFLVDAPHKPMNVDGVQFQR